MFSGFSGRVFAAVTVLPALLAVAWLVPGAGLLLAGRLRPASMVIIAGALAVAMCYFAFRRVPTRWPRFEGRDTGVSPGALVLMVAVAAGFGVWEAVFRSQQVFGGGGPGGFLLYGNWIAVHGTARVPAAAASFGGAGGLGFATAGFSGSGGFLLPSVLPGVPLVLAGGAWLGGAGGTLLVPAALGGCAVLSFGGLAGRLCGGWQAVAAELVLASCLPEVYTARAPFAEPLTQVLLFGGLCLFTDALTGRPRGGGRLVLAGLALGLTVLASAGSLGVLLPALPALGVLTAVRRGQALSFGTGLLIGAGGSLAAGWVLAPSYLAALGGPLHLAGWCAAGFGAAALLGANG